MRALIENLGELALASRLKFIGERLMLDVKKIYTDQGIEFEPRWFLVFYLLSQKSRMSITEIANAIGVTHPAINQISGEMIKANIIDSSIEKKDRRKRILFLSEKGKKLLSDIKPIWEDIRIANSELMNSCSIDLMQNLDIVEDALNRKTIYERVNQKIRKRIYESIEILEYKPEYKKYFRNINYEWLEKYFMVEPVDQIILSEPESMILKKGGYILFAKYDNQIVGTCALVRHNDKEYELIKMGVTEEYQHKQIGKKLAIAAIEKVKKLKAESLYLITHVRLPAAVKLYRYLGFKPSKHVSKIDFDRKGVPMKLDLKEFDPDKFVG